MSIAMLLMLPPGYGFDASYVAPTDIALDNSTIAENAGNNAVVGTLSTDGSVTNGTYSLVSGSGDTDNALFNISGASLRATDSLNYEESQTRSVRVSYDDGMSAAIEKQFTITVIDAFEDREGLWNVVGDPGSLADGVASLTSSDLFIRKKDLSANSHGSILSTLTSGQLIQITDASGARTVQVIGATWNDPTFHATLQTLSDSGFAFSGNSEIRFLAHELARVTFTADGGQLEASSGGTAIDYGEADLATLASLFEADYGPRTFAVVDATTGNFHDWYIADAGDELNHTTIAPVVGSLYTSTAGTPNITPTVQGVDGRAVSFDIGCGNANDGTDVFSDGSNDITIDYISGLIVNVNTPSGYTLSGGGVGQSFVHFDADAVGDRPLFLHTSGPGDFAVDYSAGGNHAGVDAVPEVTTVDLGSATNGGVILTDGSHSFSVSVGDDAGTVQGSAAAGGYGCTVGKSGNVYTITADSGGVRDDLSASVNTLEIRVACSDFTVTPIQNGGS